MGEAFKGLVLGVMLGALFGVSIDLFMASPPRFFPFEVTVLCAGCFGLAFAVGGYLWGEAFLEWAVDNLHHFLP